MTAELAFAAKSELPDLRTMMAAEIPRLRRYARALVRDVVAADDLVQETLTRGLFKQHLWVEGTNLQAWLFTIMHHQYVNQVRRAVREGAAVEVSETEPSLSCAPSQVRSLELRDLDRALAELPEEQRAVILLVGLEGLRYDAVAAIIDVPVGYRSIASVARSRGVARVDGRHPRRAARGDSWCDRGLRARPKSP